MNTVEENEVFLDECKKCACFLGIHAKQTGCVSCNRNGVTAIVIPHPRNIALKGKPEVVHVVRCPEKAAAKLGADVRKSLHLA